jgi:hypothetical protein
MSFESPLPPYNSADPAASFLNSSCLDLLLIEMVPMAHRITADLHRRQLNGGYPTPPAEVDEVVGLGLKHGKTGRPLSSAVAPEEREKMDEDEERDAVFYRLEGLGYRVGQGLVERFVPQSPLERGSSQRRAPISIGLWTLFLSMFSGLSY